MKRTVSVFILLIAIKQVQAARPSAFNDDLMYVYVLAIAAVVLYFQLPKGVKWLKRLNKR